MKVILLLTLTFILSYQSTAQVAATPEIWGTWVAKQNGGITDSFNFQRSFHYKIRDNQDSLIFTGKILYKPFKMRYRQWNRGKVIIKSGLKTYVVNYECLEYQDTTYYTRYCTKASITIKHLWHKNESNYEIERVDAVADNK